MNILEIGLSFLEGLALIVSPCILPVLPLVLSASVEGGRRRPFGIITGFVCAFSTFALLSRKLVSVFHINLDIIRYASLALLLLFGLVLLSSKLSAKFSSLTQGAANIGNTIAVSGDGGFISGIGIGALIGLIWTPCAGPILAAVLVQVIRQQSDAAGMLMIFAFALGAGIPMLLIALTGRKIMSKLGFFTTHAETIRKTFGALIIASVVFIASGVDVQALFSSGNDKAQANIESLQDGLITPYAAPEFTGIDAWINSKPLLMKDLKGKVVLIDFWTYSCINCVRTLPYIVEWDKKYRDKGLVIIGVHAPEFEFEKDLGNVRKAVVQHGIEYPVALDSELVTWSNFNNRYWPAHYLIDKSGNVVYTHFGEGHYDITENNIRYLLGLNDKEQTGDTAQEMSVENQSPETYLGNARMKHYSGNTAVVVNQTVDFQFPDALPLHGWALKGKWKIEPERITAMESGAALRFHFNARKVFLVMGNAAGKPIDVAVTLNGSKVGVVKVNGNTLYALIDQKSAKEGLLEIKATAPGLEAYAFTFGG